MRTLRRKVAILVLIVLTVGVWLRYGELSAAPPYAYPLELALENGDVVNHRNIDKLDRFVEDSKSKGTDRVRIVVYTIEGDAVLYDLIKENGKLGLIIDNTRDKFGSGEITEYELIEVYKETIEDKVLYIAKLSSGEELTLLTR